MQKGQTGFFNDPVLLVVLGVLAVVFAAPRTAAGGWETVKEFYGTITIKQTLDYEAESTGILTVSATAGRDCGSTNRRASTRSPSLTSTRRARRR